MIGAGLEAFQASASRRVPSAPRAADQRSNRRFKKPYEGGPQNWSKPAVETFGSRSPRSARARIDLASPRTAFWLGIAGLIPFIWGALTGLLIPLANWGAATLGGRFCRTFIFQLFYGTVILFLTCLACYVGSQQSDQRGPRPLLGISSLCWPALWAFFH